MPRISIENFDANVPNSLDSPRTMEAALDKVFKSKDYQDFLLARGFGAVYANAAGFATHLAAADVSLGNSMKEAGLAK